jgi:hypothetical protein
MAKEKLQSRPMSPRPAKITVRFDQQQCKLLDFLREERTFGTEDGEIIRNVVLDYLAQQKEARPKPSKESSKSTRSTARKRRSGR